MCSLLRQDPVPEEPRPRRSSEEAEAHRRVLQGKGSGECRAALLPGGLRATTSAGISLLGSADIRHRENGASQTPPRLTGQVETGRCLLPGSLQHFPWQTLCTGLVPHSLSKGSKPHLP